MGKFGIILVVGIIVVLLTSFIIALYFFFEKPAEVTAPQDLHDISIRVVDENKTQIQIPFDIILNGQIYASYNSSSSVYTTIKLPSNNTFQIYTNSKSYYNSFVTVDTYSLQRNLRFDLQVFSYGNASLTSRSVLVEGNEIFLDAKVDGIFKNPIICVRWSQNIIDVSLFNSTLIIPPTRLTNKVDKCFSLGKKILEDRDILDIVYTPFGHVTEADSLKLYILDGDISYSTSGLVLENKEGEDIGIPDIYLKIPYQRDQR